MWSIDHIPNLPNEYEESIISNKILTGILEMLDVHYGCCTHQQSSCIWKKKLSLNKSCSKTVMYIIQTNFKYSRCL